MMGAFVLFLDAGRDTLVIGPSPGFRGVTTWDLLVLGAERDLVGIRLGSEILACLFLALLRAREF